MSADAAPPRPPERVALFIDYQNAYMRAREAFHALAEIAHTAGQFNPLDLGNLIVSKGGHTVSWRLCTSTAACPTRHGTRKVTERAAVS